ncbi:MAG: 2-hydroxyacyl-CoA dehydratase, partial [Chloroflexi bacterium]|nr:2-hydroxyacyl-CoA dehydratase [Chloroflexota bacterium]
HLPTPFSHFIYVPNHIQAPSARARTATEVKQFKSAVESWTGAAITGRDLKRAVNTYNTNRRLMTEIYELRKQDNPPLSGAEAMYMVMASMYMDKAEHNRLLRQLLSALPQRGRLKQGRLRAMYLSSESDAANLVQLIESLGAEVVVDDNCIGTRYFVQEVNIGAGKDLLDAIADRYVDKPPCPVKDMVERLRLPYIKKLVQDFRVDAAIYAKMKFCDPHEYDIPSIKKMLEDMGVPLLILECDITIPEGQFRTRVEAFLEMQQLEKV